MAAVKSDLWPARLHHLRRDSPQPERLARFYGELLGDRVERLPGDSWLVAGPGRRLVVGAGEAAAVPYFALEVLDAAHLKRLAKAFQRHEAFASPLLEEGAFALRDPDGRQVAFGIAKNHNAPQGLPGRLQHFVCATTRLPEMLDFYKGLGMVESDRVLENGELTASFLRSDPEHHSFAAFRAPESRSRRALRRHAHRRVPLRARQGGAARDRRRADHVQVPHALGRQELRRPGHGAARRPRPARHGDGAVPPDRPAGGYAHAHDRHGAGGGAAAEAAQEALRGIGIHLDTTYTAKAAAALLDQARHAQGTVLFWHTLSAAEPPLPPHIGIDNLPAPFRSYLQPA
jgi:hypothetical protein